MKKGYIVLLILFFCFPSIVLANSRESVIFDECIDGDTAKVLFNGETIKVRFLAIDTPETKHPTKDEEAYGKDASEYTCNRLKKAKDITLEFDPNSDKLDKYNRYLAWVFIDGSLLQEELISNGLAKVAYLYGDYKYTSVLQSKEKIAKDKKLGIWSEAKQVISLKDYIKNMKFIYKLIITIIILIIICLYLYFDKNARKKLLKKGKRKIINEIKKGVK